LISIIVILVPGLAVAAGDTGEYRDDFGDVSFSGSDGSLPWAAKWVESGESDGPEDGALHVGKENCSNNKCLHIEASNLVPNLAISRKADLSGFVSANLSYDLFIDPAPLSTGTLSIEARGGGSGWTELERYLLLTEGGEHFDSIDVTGYMGPDFEIRFGVSGLIGGDIVTVDRVVIEGPSTTSTTTSTTVKSTTTSAVPSTPTSTSATSPTTSTSPTTTTGPSTTSTSRSETTTTALSAAATSSSTTSTTSTTAPLSGGGPDSSGGNGSMIGSLRDPGVGLLADYRQGMMGDIDINDVEVLGVELSADFSMAVEVFEAARIWVAVLALLVAAAIIAEVDRRRRSEKSGS